MAVQSYLSNLFVSRMKLLSDFTQNYLNSFILRESINLHSGTQFKFTIRERTQSKKINPIIRKARASDVDEIIFTYKDIYEGTYPYKEMEDFSHILHMIQEENVEWLVFEHPNSGEFCGCFTLVLDFKDKKGYTRGFVVKKKFEGKLDVIKAFLGSFIAMFSKYEGKIFRWYGESRTAHSKSQYCMRPSGFKPVAFLPNKDMFYNKVESDLLLISYDRKAILGMRSKETPILIPKVVDCFQYSSKRYRLGKYMTYRSPLILDQKKMKSISKKILTRHNMDRFGYQKITILIKKSKSYLSFLYAPSVQNIEKVEYITENIEELHVFATELIKITSDLSVRYVEVFVSAYKPQEQLIFSKLGLSPRGYVPSWKYNVKTSNFEDYILFNMFQGKISQDIHLLDEGKELLDNINLSTSEFVF